jgi:hypothetical protein
MDFRELQKIEDLQELKGMISSFRNEIKDEELLRKFDLYFKIRKDDE